MNAVLRRKEEVHVISNDAIAAKLNHLSEGFQEVRRSQSVLETRMEALGTSLSQKLDTLKEQVLARFDKQDERINALGKRIDTVYVSVNVVLAILGLCVSAAVVANALGTLGWI